MIRSKSPPIIVKGKKMKDKKTLYLKDIKLRTEQTEEGKKFLIGLIPYNSEGSSMSGFYKEVITNTAFNQSLNSKRRIVALKNHNDDYPLGNTEAGTLSLTSTKEGLECRCELPDTSFANDLIVSVERGDCTGMSFGFIPVKEDEKDGIVYLREVKLLEVSYGVVFPFYPEATASVDMRSAIKNVQNLLFKRGNGMDKEVLALLKQLIGDLQKIITEAEGGNADENKEPAPDNKAAAQAQEPKKDDAEKTASSDDEEKKKKEDEERALKIKKERTALLQRLDLISL